MLVPDHVLPRIMILLFPYIVSKEFNYQFNITGQCDDTLEGDENYLVTEIYVPPMIYTNHQFDLQLSECLSWEFSKQNDNIVLIHFSKSTITSLSILKIMDWLDLQVWILACRQFFIFFQFLNLYQSLKVFDIVPKIYLRIFQCRN